MANAKQVRIIKRGQQPAQSSEQAQATSSSVTNEGSREIKGVVSGWVREHSRRADEFRQNYSTLLKELGFAPPLSCRT